MNSVEKSVNVGLRFIGAGALGAAACYVAVGSSLFPYGEHVNEAKEDVACADALSEENGRFEELPGACVVGRSFFAQRSDRQENEFFHIAPDGTLMQETTIHTVKTFETIEEISETAASRLSWAETEKQDAQEQAAIIGAGAGLVILAGVAAARLKIRSRGKHNPPNNPGRRQKTRIKDPSVSSEEKPVSTRL